MLQIARNRITAPDDAEIHDLSSSFARDGHARLRGLIQGSFLDEITALIAEDQFTERHTPNIGCVETLANDELEHVMYVLLNQEPIKATVSRIIGRSVQLWLGNTVRRVPGRDHFSSWHDDMNPPLQVGENWFQRAVPMSLNLTPEPFEGGNLEMRRLPEGEIIADIPNKGYGDALLFRIAAGLQHRVADVHGTVPRLVHVGWFHARIDPP